MTAVADRPLPPLYPAGEKPYAGAGDHRARHDPRRRQARGEAERTGAGGERDRPAAPRPGAGVAGVGAARAAVVGEEGKGYL